MTECDKRLCLFCKNMQLEPAQSGYSEFTPESDVWMGCYKGHWELSLWKDTTETYREKLLMAQTCPDYDEIDMIEESSDG